MALAERSPLDAVVAADDQGVIAAAHACERLGLRGNAPAAAARTRDKAALREALAAAEIDQPDFRVAEPGDDVAALAASSARRAWSSRCRSRPAAGSSAPTIRAAAAAAAERIRSILADADRDPAAERLLVERYEPGVEVAVEGLLVGGRLEILAVFDKPDPLEGPYFEETIFVTPSRLPAKTLEAVRRGRRRRRRRPGACARVRCTPSCASGRTDASSCSSSRPGP